MSRAKAARCLGNRDPELEATARRVVEGLKEFCDQTDEVAIVPSTASAYVELAISVVPKSMRSPLRMLVLQLLREEHDALERALLDELRGAP